RRSGRLSGDALIQALAVVAEAARRATGLRPHEVQLMGALAVYRGFLAEMATGEGKTLTVSLAGVLSAWHGRAVHMLTANDYLAARDAETMGPVYAACAVSVGSVTEEVDHADRPALYRSDVVYTTAKDLLADYLRDLGAGAQGTDAQHLAYRRWALGRDAAGLNRSSPLLLTRGLDTVIVDEADSLLIDEAVTPLILSIPREDDGLDAAVRVAAEVADCLEEGADYRLVRKHRSVLLNPAARERVAERAAELPRLWQAAPRREELLRQALSARHFIERDHQYVVQDDKVVLLDQFTGRLTPNRSLSAGLHQALEVKEGVTITAPTETLGQMSFQTFFRHFRHLSGITGTARETAAEFWRNYDLRFLTIPPNKVCRRVTHRARYAGTQAAAMEAVTTEVQACRERGQPVLIGVRKVSTSQVLSEALSRAGIDHELLNALNHGEEADIVARAGRIGRVTIATNMAGRGTDIKLGEGVEALGGLHVIIAECNESGRVDRQLAGRCARQGDPGSVVRILGLDDEMISKALPFPAGAMPSVLAPLLFRYAQWRAERKAAVQRKMVMKADDWVRKTLPF
ncbi:MAG: hypothetical protein ACPGU7_14205, partial [Gammaproteobacteria bacterium]